MPPMMVFGIISGSTTGSRGTADAVEAFGARFLLGPGKAGPVGSGGGDLRGLRVRSGGSLEGEERGSAAVSLGLEVSGAGSALGGDDGGDESGEESGDAGRVSMVFMARLCRRLDLDGHTHRKSNLDDNAEFCYRIDARCDEQVRLM